MPSLYILYGSATGNAEQIAKDLSSKTPPKPYDKIICLEMDKYKKHLEDVWVKDPCSSDDGQTIYKHGIILISSTTGNGDVPENASRFVRYIKRKTTLEKKPFQHCTFSVLGLGDTNYDNFCAAGKLLDKYIEILGGTRAKPLACADEATGLEDVVEPFIETVFTDIVKSSTTKPTTKEEGETTLATARSKDNRDKTKSQETKEKPIQKPIRKEVPLPTKSSTPLFILYGSQTGNAEQIAKDLSSTYNMILKNPDAKCYFPSTVCCTLDKYKKDYLTKGKEKELDKNHGIIVVISTTGNGEAPENATRFVSYVKRQTRRDPPSKPFTSCTYAVLGLGDTNYDNFCASGKNVDKYLSDCGGTRAISLSCADEATGLEDVVEPWTNNIFNTITNACRENYILFNTDTTNSNPTKGGQDQLVVSTTINTNESNNKENKQYINTSNTPITTSTDKSKPLLRKIEDTATASEEKKMDQQDKIDSVRNHGVNIVCSLLQENNVPTIDHSLLPSIGTRLSSCELIDDSNVVSNTGDGTIHRRSRGMSFQEEMEKMTVSSASTSGIYYNQSKPYHTNILNARYLTNTSDVAAKEICQTIGIDKFNTSNNDSNDNIIKAMDIYEKHFPLEGTSHENCDKNSTYERNGKRVIEMTLALPDDYTLEYKPGDSLGFVVSNTPHAVNFILDMLQKHHSIDGKKQLVSIDASNHPITVENVVRNHIDLCTPIKNKRLLNSLSQYARNYEEECALRLLASKTSDGEELFNKYIDEQRMTIIDVLRDFPSCQSMPLQGLLSILPAIPPRYYSVSSSPLANNKNSELSLTVTFSVVDYLTPSLIIPCSNSGDGSTSSNSNRNIGRRRIGGIATRYLELLCSPFLCNNGSDGIDKLPKLRVFPKPTAEFRMPDTLMTPLVLIGPGTGISPFMGFLAHRKALISTNTDAASSVVEGTWRGGFDMETDDLPISRQDSKGLSLAEDYKSKLHQNVGDVDVFFGCRHADHDWLYREEMEKFRDDGIISNLYTAFSRDGKSATDRKTYVQDLMRNDEICGLRLSSLIVDNNASVYVCGDGNAMGRDVQSAIVNLIAKKKNISADEANKYLEKMKADNRFVLDIWTS